MEADKEDLLFLARLYHEIKRPQDALDCLDKIAQKYPDLAEANRRLFEAVYKDVIDTQRHTIRTLRSYYDNEQHDHHALKADMIRGVLDKEYAKLVAVCERGLALIRDHLLPNATDSKARAFFHTKQGDFNRYLGECGTDASHREFLGKAKKEYERSLAICAEDLPSRDPVRLETILVSAVFEHEHMRRTSSAIALLRGALRRLDPAGSVVNEDAERTIQMMKKNIIHWSNAA